MKDFRLACIGTRRNGGPAQIKKWCKDKYIEDFAGHIIVGFYYDVTETYYAIPEDEKPALLAWARNPDLHLLLDSEGEEMGQVSEYPLDWFFDSETKEEADHE